MEVAAQPEVEIEIDAALCFDQDAGKVGRGDPRLRVPIDEVGELRERPEFLRCPESDVLPRESRLVVSVHRLQPSR